MHWTRKITLLITPYFIAACSADEGKSEDAPLNPSWQVDVMPILSTRCVGCHGAIVTGGAPPTLRLDSYGPVPNTDGTAIAGAASAALQIFKRVSGIGLLRNDLTMPPSGGMDQYEITVLRNWAALSDGNGTAPRGPGNSGNSVPTVTLTETARSAVTVTFAANVRDGDDDRVIVALLGPKPDGEVGVVGTAINGDSEVTINIADIAPGTYPMTARVDDGADVDGVDGDADYVDIDLPMLTIQ